MEEQKNNGMQEIKRRIQERCDNINAKMNNMPKSRRILVVALIFIVGMTMLLLNVFLFPSTRNNAVDAHRGMQMEEMKEQEETGSFSSGRIQEVSDLDHELSDSITIH